MKVPKQIFIEDLMLGQIAVIEGRMRPGQYSCAGFLDQNQSLREVIETDAKVLEEYEITHKQVGDRLESLMGQADRGDLVNDFLRVFAVGWRGYQFCPFFYETEKLDLGSRLYSCGRGDHDFTVKNERQGTEIRFPQLMAHLVRDHHFFEGNVSYRLNPEDAIKVLELKPGVDYTPKSYWK